MSTPEPPPIEPRIAERPRFQFNTAMLLGAMALVAVVCMLAVTVPGLLVTMLGLIATAVLVAYTAFLVAGSLRGSGDYRLFAMAAATSLLVSIWGAPNTMLPTYFLQGVGLSPVLGTLIWALVAPVQHVVFSLFGGWISLRAAKFWEAQTVVAEAPDAQLKEFVD